jgi:hypothetical protein
MRRRTKTVPTVVLCSRLDLASQERRERLQTKLDCTVPELLKRAFLALEEKVMAEAGKAA